MKFAISVNTVAHPRFHVWKHCILLIAALHLVTILVNGGLAETSLECYLRVSHRVRPLTLRQCLNLLVVEKLAPNIGFCFHHVGGLILGQQVVTGAFPTGSGGPTTPVSEHLHVAWKIIVNDVIEVRNIEPSGSDIRHYKHLLERFHRMISDSLIKGTEHETNPQTCSLQNCGDILHMMPCSSEHHSLLIL